MRPLRLALSCRLDRAATVHYVLTIIKKEADMLPASPATALLVALLVLCMVGGEARAQSTPSDAPDVVRVTGLRAIPWKSYRAMRAAMDAYARYKGHAQDAEFNFGLLLPDGYRLPPNFAMRVRTPDGREYPIVMKGVLFTPPILPNDALDADVVTNLKGVAIRVGTQIDTPGVPAGMDRLGDRRLECQIDRAIRRVEDDLVTRLLRPNYCEHEAATYWMSPSQPADSAELVDGERRMTLRTSNGSSGMRFQIPLHDSGWSDNALVVYQYQTPFRGNPAPLRFIRTD